MTVSCPSTQPKTDAWLREITAWQLSIACDQSKLNAGCRQLGPNRAIRNIVLCWRPKSTIAAAGDVDASLLLVSHILKKLNCFHTDEEKNLLTVNIADQLMLVT
jgi:hypothetical protein